MKNKTTTYFLISVVLGVWGVIFYRIFNSISDGEDTSQSKAPKVVMKMEDYKTEASFGLLLNYRDPFLGKQRNYNEGASLQPIRKATPPPPKPEVVEPVIDWGFIAYVGQIKNPATNIKVALVNLRGREYMTSEGDIIEDIEVLKYFKDSIQISYLGKVKFIKRQ